MIYKMSSDLEYYLSELDTTIGIHLDTLQNDTRNPILMDGIMFLFNLTT